MNITKTCRARSKRSTTCSAICGPPRRTQSSQPFATEIQLRAAVGRVLAQLQRRLAARRIEVDNQIPG